MDFLSSFSFILERSIHMVGDNSNKWVTNFSIKCYLFTAPNKVMELSEAQYYPMARLTSTLLLPRRRKITSHGSVTVGWLNQTKSWCPVVIYIMWNEILWRLFTGMGVTSICLSHNKSWMRSFMSSLSFHKPRILCLLSKLKVMSPRKDPFLLSDLSQKSFSKPLLNKCLLFLTIVASGKLHTLTMHMHSSRWTFCFWNFIIQKVPITSCIRRSKGGGGWLHVQPN